MKCAYSIVYSVCVIWYWNSVCCCMMKRLVQYESADSAERALVELQESLLDGRRLFLRKVCPLKFVLVIAFVLVV